MFDCGVPAMQCSGTVITNHQTGISEPRGTYKAHGSQDEARKCQKKWLAAHNASRPEGAPILLGSKPQRLRREHRKANRLITPKIR